MNEIATSKGATLMVGGSANRYKLEAIEISQHSNLSQGSRIMLIKMTQDT